MDSLDGRVALLTGATGGLGRALAEALAAEGARLVLVARTADALQSLASGLAARHRTEAQVVVGDPATESVNRDAVGVALRRWNRLDVAASCAGLHAFGPVTEAAVAASMMRANFFTKANLAAAAAPPMVSRGRGAMLFVSSMASTVPLAGQAAYCASMAAVDHYARSLALELGVRGVSVHAYAPGLVDTPLARSQFSDMARTKLGSAASVERFWKEDVLQPAAAAREMVAILKNPERYKDAVVPRPPKVVL